MVRHYSNILKRDVKDNGLNALSNNYEKAHVFLNIEIPLTEINRGFQIYGKPFLGLIS